MKISSNRAAILGAFALQFPAVGHAATDGTLGATSTGSLNISATVPGRVQISGLSDVTFGTIDPASGASNAQNVCVWSNTNGRRYNITATGNGPANAFSLTDGTNLLNYSVEWSDTSGQTSGTALATGTALTGLTSTAISPTCSAGPANSASLIIGLSSANLQAAVAGSYAGALTLVVAPE